MAVQADLTRVTPHRCALRNAQQPGASRHEAGHTDRHLQSSSFDVTLSNARAIVANELEHPRLTTKDCPQLHLPLLVVLRHRIGRFH
jgi:hypothetical protein